MYILYMSSLFLLPHCSWSTNSVFYVKELPPTLAHIKLLIGQVTSGGMRHVTLSDKYTMNAACDIVCFFSLYCYLL